MSLKTKKRRAKRNALRSQLRRILAQFNTTATGPVYMYIPDVVKRIKQAAGRRGQ